MTLDDAQVREIGESLFDLVGLPLSHLDCDGYRQCFQFVEPRPPRKRIQRLGVRPVEEWNPSYVPPQASWQFEAWCEWRLESPDAEPLTSALFGLTGNDQRRGREPRRAALAQLVKSRSLVVENVSVRKDGALRLGLTRDHALVVLPGGEYDMEHRLLRGDLRWRLESPPDDPRGGLIFRQEGFVRRPNEDAHWAYLPLAETEGWASPCQASA